KSTKLTKNVCWCVVPLTVLSNVVENVCYVHNLFSEVGSSLNCPELYCTVPKEGTEIKSRVTNNVVLENTERTCCNRLVNQLNHVLSINSTQAEVITNTVFSTRTDNCFFKNVVTTQKLYKIKRFIVPYIHVK